MNQLNLKEDNKTHRFLIIIISFLIVFTYLIWFFDLIPILTNLSASFSIISLIILFFIILTFIIFDLMIFQTDTLNHIYNTLAKWVEPIKQWHMLIVSLFLCLLFSVIKILKILSFNEEAFDLGIYSNIAYNITKGRWFYSSVLGYNHLAEHFSPITALASPFYFFQPSSYILAVIFGFVYGISFFLLYKLSVEVLGNNNKGKLISISLYCLFLTYRPMIRSFLFGFHPSGFGIPLLISIFYYIRKQNWKMAYILIFLLLLTKELALLALVSVALYCILYRKEYKNSIVILLIMAVMSLFIFKILFPLLSPYGNWNHYSRVSKISNLWVDTNLKLRYLGMILAPFAFIHIFKPKALLLALPLILINIIVIFRPQYSSNFHYDDMLSSVLFVGFLESIHSFYPMKTRLNTSIAKLRKLCFYLLPLIIFMCGLLMADQSPVALIKKYSPLKVHKEIRKALKPYMLLPDNQAIITDTMLSPFVCHRLRHTSLPVNIALFNFKDNDIVLISPKIHQVNLAKAEKFFDKALEKNYVSLLQKDSALWAYKILDCVNIKEVDIQEFVLWEAVVNSSVEGNKLVLGSNKGKLSIVQTKLPLKPSTSYRIDFAVSTNNKVDLFCDFYYIDKNRKPPIIYDDPKCQLSLSIDKNMKRRSGIINSGESPPPFAFLRFYTISKTRIIIDDITISEIKN